MPNAIRWMRCTSIPQTMATSRLCEVARIALPSFVFWRKTNASAVIAAAYARPSSESYGSPRAISSAPRFA